MFLCHTLPTGPLSHLKIKTAYVLSTLPLRKKLKHIQSVLISFSNISVTKMFYPPVLLQRQKSETVDWNILQVCILLASIPDSISVSVGQSYVLEVLRKMQS